MLLERMQSLCHCVTDPEVLSQDVTEAIAHAALSTQIFQGNRQHRLRYKP
jgi:DnaJ-domain-containing protein 1